MPSSTFSHLLVLILMNVYVHAVDVTVPAQAPGSAGSIAQDHISLSIEQDRWTDWVGTTSRNEIFYNSLDNLARLTGLPPRIRIGGQSGDSANFGTAVTYSTAFYDNATISKDLPYPGAFGMQFGEKFYPTVRFLPSNTKVVVTVNYGANDDLRASSFIGMINKAFVSPEVADEGVTLEAIELGHEPDRYGKDNTYRSWDPKWSDTSSKYIPEWSNWVKNIIEISNSGFFPPASNPNFWAGSISTTGGQRSATWTARNLVNSNVLSANTASNVKTFSQHHYPGGNVCRGGIRELRDLVSKSNIRRGLDAFKEDIAAVKAKGLEYILGEANSFSCHGAAGVSNVAGSAIWALDYLLYASQIGVSRVYFAQGVGYKFNFLQPTALSRSPLDNSPLSPPSPPHIQPSYYAAIIAAEAIGSSGQTRIVEIPASDPSVSGYAFYVGDKLTKALFINHRVYIRSDSSRSQTRVNIKIDGAVGQATVKRLVIPSADATEGITWGGLSYQTADARPQGISRIEVLDLSQGLDIRDSEAALVSFE